MSWRWSLAVLASVPAVALLVASLAFGSPAPEPMAWCELWGDPTPPLTGADLLDFGSGPLLIAQRVCALWLLHAPWGPTPVGWLLALLTMAGVLALLPAQARHFAAVPLALALFAPAFGGDWLLEARLRVFAPAVCMVWAAVALVRAARLWRAVVTAGVLAVAAVFLAREGAVVGFALVPVLIAAVRRHAHPRPWLLVAGWLLVVNLGVAASRVEVDPGNALWERDPYWLYPGRAAVFLLAALGGAALDLAPGTRTDDALIGAALLAALVVLARGCRRMPQALPWVAVAVAGIGIAAVNAAHWLPPRLADAAQRETQWSVLLFPVGVAGAALACGHLRTTITAALLCSVLAAVTWSRGFDWLAQVARLLRQGEALAMLADLPDVQRGATHHPPVGSRAGRELLVRLGRASPPLADPTLAGLDARTEPAGLAGLVTLAPPASAHGHVRHRLPGFTPDLVLLFRQAKAAEPVLFAVAAPDLLAGGEALPWSAEFGDAPRFGAGERLRVQLFDGRQRALMEIGTGWVFDGEQFVPPEGQR